MDSLQTTVKTARRGAGRPFPEGQSGNPSGRPRGSKNRKTRAAELLLESESEALTRKAVEMALAGDALALRLCLDRIMAPRRDRTVAVALPPIRGAADLADAMTALTAAAADGLLAPAEAFELARTIEIFARAIATTALASRVTQLEDAYAARP